MRASEGGSGVAFTTAYVLVDHGRGLYASMVEVSVRVFRRTQPGVPVVLVADEDSRAYLTGDRGRLLDLFDRVIWVEASLPKLVARSFEMKSRLRSLIAGNLAYLDGDTLPVRPFGEVFDREGWDMALVQDRNHHRPVKPTPPDWIRPKMQLHGWEGTLTKYFNAGVQYLRDNPVVHQVVSEWRTRLFESHRVGEHDDQLPFNYTLYTTTAPVKVFELPTAYNAMVGVHPVHARGAKILHFFYNSVESDTGSVSLIGHLIRHLDATGEVDWDSLDRCVALDHPWMPPYWPRRLWQTGNRVRAVVTAIRQRLGFGARATVSEGK